MDAEQIRRLEPQLAEFLDRFEDCFARRDTRHIFRCTCEGSFRNCRERAWSRWRWRPVLRCGRCRSS